MRQDLGYHNTLLLTVMFNLVKLVSELTNGLQRKLRSDIMPRSIPFLILLCLTITAFGQQSDTLIVHFEVDRAELTYEDKESIKTLVSSTGAIDSVLISAHTDADGSSAYNRDLSLRRAAAVRDYIVQSGVSETAIAMEWLGESQPLRPNQSVRDKAINRRARIICFRGLPVKLITGRIADSSGVGLDANVVIRGKEFLDSARTDSTGKFSILVPDSTVLGADVFAEGFIYQNHMFNSARSDQLAMTLRPIGRDVRFELHRFYFVGNKAVLLPTSEPELARLLRFMTLNPTVIIAIEGHVNFPNRPDVPRDSWEYDLSWRRARLVYDYLIENKVNPDRLSFDGFGNWHMVYPRARNEEQASRNRRVEIRIVGV